MQSRQGIMVDSEANPRAELEGEAQLSTIISTVMGQWKQTLP